MSLENDVWCGGSGTPTGALANRDVLWNGPEATLDVAESEKKSGPAERSVGVVNLVEIGGFGGEAQVVVDAQEAVVLVGRGEGD